MTYIIALIIIVIDQWIKVTINNNFFIGESIPIVQGLFHLTFVKNTGAGFGIMAGYRNLFIYITIIIILGLIIFRKKAQKNTLLDLATGLIIGGGCGNLIDRIWMGYVIDYLDFRIWPVFNLADSMVVIGSGILLIYIWKYEDGLDG